MSRMTRLEKRQQRVSDLQRINKELNIRYLKLQAKYCLFKAKMLEIGADKISRDSPIPVSSLEAERAKYYKLLAKYKKLRARMLDRGGE